MSKKAYLNRKEQLHSKKILASAENTGCNFFWWALIVPFPVLLLIVWLIYIDDPKGSSIFSQIRVERNLDYNNSARCIWTRKNN